MGAGCDAIGRGAAAAVAVVLAAALCLAGCRRPPPPELPPPEAAGVSPAEPAPAQPPAPPPAFVPPPTLADLDAQAAWLDRPVRRALTVAREDEAREPPACPLAEALDIVNDSDAANARIVAALFRAPEAGERIAGDRATRHLLADVVSLNPLRAESVAEFDVLALTGVDLFGFDRSLAPFANADVVASWQTSRDGLLDKVVLHDNLTWSDGAAVTAHDIVFSWQLAADPRVPARAFRTAAARLRAVKAYDDHTVVMFHAEPGATAAWDLDLPVIPRHVYATTWQRDPSLVTSPEHAALEDRPVTGGPYEVAQRAPGHELVLRRRRGWSEADGRKVREPPPFEEIRFRVVHDSDAALDALANATLDEIVLAPAQWSANAALSDVAVKVMTPEWRVIQVVWNLDGPLFADRGVRRAMDYAFDHARLVEQLCHGLATPASGPFAPDSWATAGRRAEPRRQDRAKAEALLDAAGWVDQDGDGVRDRDIDGRRVPCEFSVLCDRRPLHVAIGELVCEAAQAVGVRCTVRSVDPGDLRALVRDGRFDACLGTWAAGVDPDSLSSALSSDGPQNDGGYANPEVDTLFVAARRERDPQRRADLYGRIEAILAEDQPCSWLVWRRELRGISRRIAGELFGVRGTVHWSPGLSTFWKPAIE